MAEAKLTRIQARPCARCVKRSIGHLCHDEPRESSKGAKNEDLSHAADAQHKESLPYLFSPVKHHADPQELREENNPLISGTVDPMKTSPQSLHQSSNLLNQGSAFPEVHQQCERKDIYCLLH